MMKNRILIADDDEVFRESLVSFLRRLGYDCVGTHDSAQALEMLGASKFDLLICDLRMPGNDDLALIREVSRAAPGLPVILLTAHPQMESAVQSVRLPVAAYLVKPPDLENLKKLLREILPEPDNRGRD